MNSRARSVVGWMLASVIALSPASTVLAARGGFTSDLSGIWRFQTDPADRGVAERWYARPLADEIRLPGSMAECGKGDPIRVSTAWTGHIVDSSWFTDPALARFREPGKVLVPFWLTPKTHYVGVAWYQRTVSIPSTWSGRQITLTLERVHWTSNVWVDTVFAGSGASLATPHAFDLTRFLAPGTHVITLRIDNRLEPVNVGSSAHSVSDHTQTNWHGVVGVLSLEARPACGIDGVAVNSDSVARAFLISVKLRRSCGEPVVTGLRISGHGGYGARMHDLPVRTYPIPAAKDSTPVQVTYPLGPHGSLWDEFVPALYTLSVSVVDARGRVLDTRAIRSGVRQFTTRGTQCVMNGRPVMLRGTLESAIFPRTGYPPTDVASWKKIFAQCRAFGLNHMRFHSWCPPDAAFAAADEIGMYLHVETGMWTAVGDGKPLDAWLYAEAERIIHAYGHHPSFCMLAAGNEPAGKHQEEFLGAFVTHLRSEYPGRLYTGSSGWSALPANEYHVYYGPRLQAWGAGVNSGINAAPPQTVSDYREDVRRFSVPIISHEVGQWCVFPDVREIAQYTGVLRAGNIEIVKATLADHHLGHLAHDFLMASGRLQTLCYKADIEALLRTPGIGGFHLLDLHDFPGQGTAPVGVLNAFWGTKGYVTAKEYRAFCGSTVPLARLPKLIYADAETLRAAIDCAHFGPAALKAETPRWRVIDGQNRIVRSGSIARQDVPTGTLTSLGSISVPLPASARPQRLTLFVRVGGFENHWDIWTYPRRAPAVDLRGIIEAHVLTPTLRDTLERGGTVFLIAPHDTSRSAVPDPISVGFSPIFWNTAWTQGQPPHTLGILCDPGHPALALFPTGTSSDWEWWDALHGARAVRLPVRAGTRDPIVRLIDDWNKNRPLALLAEFRVGRGRLMVSGVDLSDGRARSGTLLWLRSSILTYMAGPHFRPSTVAGPDELRSLFPGCIP